MWMEKKCLFINPAASHNVFLWWHYFFSRFFDYHVYHHDAAGKFWTHHTLQYGKMLLIGKNFIATYDSKSVKFDKNDLVIVWDVFTNTLSYTLKGKNILYYSEFFLFRKQLRKKLFFFFIGFLFFHNKKFIVPTQLAQKTFQKISKNIFTLPQIYYGDIHENKPREDDVLKLLFIGRISQKFKNIYFLIDNYLAIKEKNPKISLTLVGEIHDGNFLEKYKEQLADGTISYLWKLEYDQINAVYASHDVFILPSDSDPIGAVIQEAMAHGCAIMVSDSVWASSYVKNSQNWYIFKTNDNDEFQEKLLYLLENKALLEKYKKSSIEIIKNEYRYKNEELLKKIYQNLSLFINK